jgi:hypothetical protein
MGRIRSYPVGGIRKAMCDSESKKQYSDKKYNVLERISKTGTVMEFVLKDVPDFDSKEYPATIDPKNELYRLYYRQKNK